MCIRDRSRPRRSVDVWKRPRGIGMQIVHIVNGADIGGAMTQVIALSGAQRKSGTVELIAIGPGKVIANGRRLGIPVRECAMRPAALRRLCLLYTSPSPRDRTRSRMP